MLSWSMNWLTFQKAYFFTSIIRCGLSQADTSVWGSDSKLTGLTLCRSNKSVNQYTSHLLIQCLQCLTFKISDPWTEALISWSPAAQKRPSWSLAYQYLFVSHLVNQWSSKMCYRVRVGLGRAAKRLRLVTQGQPLSERLRLPLSCLCSLKREMKKLKGKTKWCRL